ncbi:hypothetical protein V2G26_013647 [Clonostachys chloroleuca]
MHAPRVSVRCQTDHQGQDLSRSASNKFSASHLQSTCPVLICIGDFQSHIHLSHTSAELSRRRTDAAS